MSERCFSSSRIDESKELNDLEKDPAESACFFRVFRQCYIVLLLKINSTNGINYQPRMNDMNELEEDLKRIGGVFRHVCCK